MTDRRGTPPEAELLKHARERMHLSIPVAAKRASASMPPGAKGISAGRLRQIEAGYQTVTKGVQVPTSASHVNLAHLAKFYGIPPEDLEAAERPEAARILRDIQGVPPQLSVLPGTRPEGFPDGEEELLRRYIAAPPAVQRAVQALMRQQDGHGGAAPWSQVRPDVDAVLRLSEESQGIRRDGKEA